MGEVFGERECRFRNRGSSKYDDHQKPVIAVETKFIVREERKFHVQYQNQMLFFCRECFNSITEEQRMQLGMNNVYKLLN